MHKNFLKSLVKKIKSKVGFNQPPKFSSLEEITSYVEKQAAYVSQTTLYGYVKTRAGTQWPKLFNDETYLISLRMARWYIFGACVADLALFICSRLVVETNLSEQKAEDVCGRITDAILLNNSQTDIDQSEFVEMASRAKARASYLSWRSAAEEPITFKESADAFVRWAPMAEEFKDQDEEIMRNSIHLRWIGVRREVREQMNSKVIGQLKEI